MTEIEIRKAITMVVIMYNVKELPDEITMGWIYDYIKNHAPIVSVDEFIEAFKLNAINKLPDKTVCYGAVTLEFISNVLSSYAELRSQNTIKEWRKPLPETNQIPQNTSWLMALKQFIEKNGIPLIYNWGAVYSELKEKNLVNDTMLEAEINRIKTQDRKSISELIESLYGNKAQADKLILSNAEKNIVLKYLYEQGNEHA